MAAAIKQEFAVNSELIPGSNGVFDVVANGKLIFSKKAAGRFPEDDEVLGALELMQSGK